MNLIEVYVYEVTRRLPDKSRDDIALELTSTIEDMLPENFTENEVMDALSKLGDPAQLAASYRDTPNYLIGPKSIRCLYADDEIDHSLGNFNYYFSAYR